MRTNHRAQYRGPSEKHGGQRGLKPQSVRAADARGSLQDRERVDKLTLIPLKLLRFAAVRERTGLSRSTVWRLERRGGFPKHIKVSANIVAWLEEDVIERIRSKSERVA